ncbi:hypothetical protein GCM10027051_36450 [Niabella terrae]
MCTHILFIHGAGASGYEEGQQLVAALESHLQIEYEIRFPKMPEIEDNPDYVQQWLDQIDREVRQLPAPIILAGHSLGASLLLKYYTEHTIAQPICGIFLIATPFWSGDEDWKKPLRLREDFAAKISKKQALFFYHSTDDEIIPVSHLATYKKQLPWAIFRESPTGRHPYIENIHWVALDMEFVALLNPGTHNPTLFHKVCKLKSGLNRFDFLTLKTI